MPHTESQLHSEALRRILAVARHLSASADLREILSVIIDAVRDILRAERATVFQYDAQSNELFTSVAHGVDEATANVLTVTPAAVREIRIPATSGLAGECAQTRRIINVPDAYADDRFNQAIDRQTGYRTRSILTIPLLAHDGELIGVAQVLNKRAGPFDGEDQEIAAALAAQAAVAIKRGRLIEDRLVRLKLERDLELARTIQQSSFPAQLPQIEGFDIAAWNEPAEQTGGDVYDVVARDDRGVVMLMADATGHGVGPALSATQLRSMLRMAIRLNADLAQIALQANQQLCHDLPEGRFVTAWLGELDGAHSQLTSLSAGQAPLLHYKADRDTFDVLDADGVPLGIVESAELVPAPSFHMKPGDIFAVISDGLFEANDQQERQFGLERVKQCLRAERHSSADRLITTLRDEVDRYTGGLPAEDDRTAIIIKRLGPTEG